MAVFLGMGLRSRLWLPVGASAAFLVGHFHISRALGRLRPPARLMGRMVEVEGFVNSPPRISERGLYFVLKPFRYKAGRERGRWRWGEITVLFPEGEDLRGKAREVAPGRMVILRGLLRPPAGASNPGVFHAERYFAGRGVGARVKALHLSVGPVAGGFAPKLAWLSHRARKRAEAVLTSAGVGPGDITSRVLLGMAFGKAVSPVPPMVEEEFRRAGVAHVLVVSGMHVTALSLFVLALCKGYLLGLWRVLLPGVASFFYIALAGFSPSAVRAWLMGLVLFLAPAMRGDYDLLSALSVAALASTLAGPFVAYSPSFQLSYLAALGIAVLYGPIDRLLRDAPPFLRKPLAVSLAAQLGIWPFFVRMFGVIPALAPISNLLVVPLCGLLLPLLLLSTLLSGVPLLWLVGGALSLACHSLAGVMLKVVHLMASTPFSQIKVASAKSSSVALAYLLVLALPMMREDLRGRGIRPESAYLLALFGAVVLLSFGVARVWRAPRLEVVFLDVGQGEAILVRSPAGRTMLVDGGHRYVRDGVEVDWGRRVVVPFLAAEGVRRLDLVVATHPDDDHVGGLTTVLEEVPVGLLLVSDASALEGAHGHLLELARRKGIKVVEALRGQRIDLGGGAMAEVLWPPWPRLKGTGADDNNNSIVLRVRYGRVRFLLPADIEEEAERLLSSRPSEVRAEVLKVAHHGSPSSSTLGFLKAVSPKVAVISVGPDNPYGFPSPQVLKRLKFVGATVYRTDFDGAVIIATDGRRLWVRTARPRRRYGR